jgi:hypothetical protein
LGGRRERAYPPFPQKLPVTVMLDVIGNMQGIPATPKAPVHPLHVNLCR